MYIGGRAVWFIITDTMVGGDEVTLGEQQLKEKIEKEEEMQEDKKEEECKREKPDYVVMLLQTTIDTVLLEEVHRVGVKMNRYRVILSKAILDFADGHEDDEPDLNLLVDAFRAGWKVFRQEEDEKTTVDAFMKAMNNQLWVDEGVDAA